MVLGRGVLASLAAFLLVATACSSAAVPPSQPTLAPAKPTTVPEIAGSAAVPAPLGRSDPATVRIELETREVVGAPEEGATFAYWTFNGSVPGPFLRVREGDTVELSLKNSAASAATHSIDLHAVNGPGGGAGATQVAPGGEKSFRFKALNPGLYVYHCATAPVPMHVASGMYGLILVEPAGGLPPVDREFAVVQAELYTNAALGTKGHHETDYQRMTDEHPTYVVFNGRTGALTDGRALKAKVGERIRMYIGVGGFLPSSFHVIGEIFDRVYAEGSIGSEPLRNVQTTLVPAGGSTIVEFMVDVPGRYLLVDHALPRVFSKGALGYLEVEGPAAPAIFDGSGGGH